MKKNYFSTFFAALMLLVAMPATAQVSSIADLYGKYKFTATIEPTKDGQEYTDLWKSECEVVIAREEGYDVVKGLLGSPKSQLITNIDDEKFWVNNPNPTESGLWDNQIGVTDLTLENLQMYTMEYYYNSTTKEITIPEFSICQFTFPEGVMTAKELAKVTNVKLTPISEDDDKEEETFDWAGTYTVKANDVQVYKQDYNFPSEFEVEIVYNKDWSMYLITKIFGMDVTELNYGGILVTPSKENPNMAEIEVGAILQAIVPGESYLYLMDMQASKQWNIQITRKEDGTFDMENFTITDGKECVAFYTGVTAAKKGDNTGEGEDEEEEETFDWTGTYTVTVGEIVVENDDYTYPETFEMEIIYDDTYGPEYVIKKFFGQDVTFNQYGWGMSAFPTATPNQIDLDLSLANGLVDLGGGTYLGMFDLEGNASKIAFKEENGVVTIDNFQVMHYAYGGTPALVATYKNVTAVKKSATDGIENTVVENNTVEGIFDLLGRKLDAITVPGLYIVNGKKVIVK